MMRGLRRRPPVLASVWARPLRGAAAGRPLTRLAAVRGCLRGGTLPLGVALAAVLAGGPVAAGGVTDLVPNLRMARPSDFHLCAAPTGFDPCPAPTADGIRYLRFSASIINVGAGPLIIRATRTCPACPDMTTKQVIRRSDGTTRGVATDAQERYETDDYHNHWHVMGMERYELFDLAALFPGDTPVGHKYGFCFFDGYPWNLGLRRAPPFPRFTYGDCGVPTSQTLRVGLSVGWRDVYPWYFGGQYIDVTGVPDGQYLVCIGADPSNDFTETNDADNQAWARVTLIGSRLTIRATGRTGCQTQLPYPVPAAQAGVGVSPQGGSRSESRSLRPRRQRSTSEPPRP